jgi:cation diffusion facilitator family transporter
MDSQSIRRRAMYLSFGVGMLMFAMKSGAYLVTGSAAILSDAMESVVHVIATGFALYSVILAGRPADARHPYGYGKIEYFSAGVEGTLIVIAAIAICYEAIRDIITGPNVRSIEIGTWIIAGAGAINMLLGLHLIRTGRRTGSLTVEADGHHVLTDSYTSIGVFVGLLLVWFTGARIIDPIVAILVALNILLTGYHLVRESVRGLMNVTDPETLRRTVEAINRVRTEEMIDLHRLRAWSAGESRFIDFHLTLPHYLQLHEAHEIQEVVHRAISGEFGGHAEVMVHLDACREVWCTHCGRADCTSRSHPGMTPEPFTVEQAQLEPRYPGVVSLDPDISARRQPG